MGQYYKFMNIDKKEVCQRNRHGYKLMEHSYVGNDYCDDILRLLSNEWKGDRIVHAGDYAEPNDKSTTQNIVEKIMNENNIKYSLYNWCDQFEETEPTSKDDIRYVYNLDKKEYVDLYRQPMQWCHYNDYEIGAVKINSFALLIGCGNGLGGGDYFFGNHQSVGNWVGDRFVASKEPLEEYKKFKLRNEIYNEDKRYYKKLKNYNDITEKKILRSEKRMFTEFIKYLKEHDKDITKLSVDEIGLLPKEKEMFTNILNKEIDLIKTSNIKDKEII